MSAEVCDHGTKVAVEPCYWCDLESRPPEPELTVDEYCAVQGHPIYGAQKLDDGTIVDRCYCGVRMDPVRSQEGSEE